MINTGRRDFNSHKIYNITSEELVLLTLAAPAIVFDENDSNNMDYEIGTIYHYRREAEIFQRTNTAGSNRWFQLIIKND